jgi:hypothetical protein
MPQPLRDLKGVRLGPVAILQRPQLAALIAGIVVRWNNVEMEMASLMCKCTASMANLEQTMAMYTAMQSDGAKRSLLKSAAQSVISVDQYEALDERLELVRTRALERNKIVHALWGTSDAHPDVLICAVPRRSYAANAAIACCRCWNETMRLRVWRNSRNSSRMHRSFWSTKRKTLLASPGASTNCRPILESSV